MKFERSTSNTVLVALLFVAVGSVALVWGANSNFHWLSVLLTNLGSFLIASVAMAVIFEFWQLRSLIEDLFRHARIAEEVRRSKLSGFSVSFHDGVDWDELFQNSTRLDILFAYGRTWRNSHNEQLRQFVSKNDRVLEVALPDPDAPVPIAELANRFNLTADEVAGNIREALGYFERLGSEAQAHVIVYFYRKAPHFSFYRFNSRVVLASYRHKVGRGPVLTLIAEQGGEFYDWVRDEWYGITKEGTTQGLTRIAYDSKTAAAPQ